MALKDLLSLRLFNKGDVDKLKTTVSKLSANSTPFPTLDGMFGSNAENGYGSKLPIPPAFLYEASRNSNELQIVFSSLKREILRNGCEFVPKYLSKCPQCDEEFDFETDECTKCGFETVEPNYAEVRLMETFFKEVNCAGQSLEEVIDECEDDFQTIDEAFMVLLKEYDLDSRGVIVSSEVKEIVRGSPVLFDLLSDSEGKLGFNEQGEKTFVCPLHRDVLQVGDRITTCPICGGALYRALYRENSEQAGKPSNHSAVYYIEGEVIHESKYFPSRDRGYSPIIAVWNKVEALRAMDVYVKDYYSKQRPPKGLLFVNTTNTDDLTKAWENVLEKTKGNPHLIHPMAVQNDSKGTVGAQFIDFMNNLTESQYVEVRQEFTSKIGARFGVMPIYQADLSQGGGLNNEGLQITVTNRAVEFGQGIWNKKMFPKLLKQFGIVDFDYELNPSEEQDEVAEVDLKLKKTQHAQMMQSMGYETELVVGDDFEFKFSQEPVNYSSEPADEDNPEFEPSFDENTFGSEPSSVGKAKSPTYLARPLKKKLMEIFDKLFKSFNYKRKPSKALVDKKVTSVLDILSGALKRATNKQIEGIYKEAIKGVSKETGIKIGFGKIDENALEVLKSRKVFKESFKNFSKSARDNIVDGIEKSFSEPDTVKSIVDSISEKVEGERYKIERIVRTESQHVSTLARSNSYKKADPKGEFKYKWLSHSDGRTTPICKEISRRTEKGVSMKELKVLIKEVALKHGSKARDLTPHCNCRSTFIKI